MKASYLPRICASAALVLTSGISATAHADQFIGFGQPGTPGSWAVEAFPVINRSAGGNVRAGANTVLAYFSKTGFTGTTRDQIEVWAGAIPGYATPVGGSDTAAGIASPNIGLEYYYNVVEPKGEYGSPNYTTFWTSPTLMIEFPNGNKDVSGFGAGGNRYAYSFSIANYVQVGKWGMTFTPVGLYYADRARNATDMGNGDLRRLRGGLSLWFADIAAGYQVTPSLWLGVHHIYSIFNHSATDFAESREGKIGPSLTYTGLSKYGVLIAANVNFGYYHSANLPHANSLTMALVKSF
ncbi:hypothetical protein [Cupriavidus pinatubonensis]|uniref:hypothetical protein n=1 Tax=Cupriavidus pinatubonensis TaxID=248026 RepID=UPI001CC5CA23|nr:hypothetical protein [Cupriavidus pinatubonensis]